MVGFESEPDVYQEHPRGEGAENEHESNVPESFDLPQAVEQEKSMLEKFRGKARSVAGALILMSAGCMSSERAVKQRDVKKTSQEPGVARVVEKQDTESKVVTAAPPVLDSTRLDTYPSAASEERMRKEEKEGFVFGSEAERDSASDINRENLTEASEVFTRRYMRAQKEVRQVRTKEDMAWYRRTNLDPYYSEYFFPSEGKLEPAEGWRSLKERKYKEEEVLERLLRKKPFQD